jgi:hypothetical protein
VRQPAAAASSAANFFSSDFGAPIWQLIDLVWLWVHKSAFHTREAMATRRNGAALDRGRHEGFRRSKAYKRLPILNAALVAHAAKARRHEED